ncbi:MAG: hypothetical protein ACT6S0_04805 [Roseateles sp.]|uniref:hypothetical protein n=1 Tax=Roseateles sp. TaxID=1971397 RepID=UPI0040352450
MSEAKLVNNGEASYFEFEADGRKERREVEMRELRYKFFESDQEYAVMAPHPVLDSDEILVTDVAGRMHVFKGPQG